MEITIQRMAARPTACVRIHAEPDQIAKSFDEQLPKVVAHVAEVGGTIAGPPYCRYYTYGPEGVDLEIGFPTTTMIPHDGQVIPSELPEVAAAVTVHVGAYDRLPSVYGELQRWIAEHGHEPDAGMWEVYLTDPGTLPPAEWRTQIVWPLKR